MSGADGDDALASGLEAPGSEFVCQTGQSGGGMVTCVVNGKQDVISLTISNDVWQEHDKEMLEDLIVAAINEGLEKSKEMWKEELAKITGGVQLPFGM